MKKITRLFVSLCLMCFAMQQTYAQISVGISVRIAPPALPVYVQPACPTDGYLWVPGYWAYDDNDGYYWVPGVWVAPPNPGLLWTPAYWGYQGGFYGFHRGYWGAHVGFYGGINYGYGYSGVGFAGGAWSGGSFRYNTAVVNVNTTVVHNTYIDRTVINNTTINNHTSYNGPGGVNAQPRPEEQAAMREQHVQPTNQQLSHQQLAGKDRNQFASVNNGHPTAAAMNRVGGRPFNEQGHVASTSTLGHANGGINRGPAGNMSGRRNSFNPANNGAERQRHSPSTQRTESAQQQPQQQPQIHHNAQPLRYQPPQRVQPHPPRNNPGPPQPHEKRG